MSHWLYWRREWDSKKTSTWRLLHTLVTLGYIHQNPQTHQFRPAPRVISLGYGYFDSLDLRQLSSPFLHELSTRLNETVSLAILNDDESIYIDRVTTKQIINVNLHVGSRLPLYSTSVGRALISEMPKVWLRRYMERLEGDPKAAKYICEGGKRLLNILKETGKQAYAINDEELVKGLRAVASPIRDRTSKIVSAVNVSVPSSRATIAELRRTFVPSLLETAEKISLALGFRGYRTTE